MTMINSARAQAIIQEHGPRAWDARDQGRLAHARGEARDRNPHDIPAMRGYFHANMGEWTRGWDSEAARAKECGQ